MCIENPPTSDNKITYIKNEKTQGLVYALNRGLDVAKYNCIAYLPSDDYYFENRLGMSIVHHL